MKIPPPILEIVYEHEDEQDPYTQWRLATYSDGSPLLVVYGALLMLLRKHVLSRMVALSRPIPTSVAGYSGWILVY